MKVPVFAEKTILILAISDDCGQGFCVLNTENLKAL